MLFQGHADLQTVGLAIALHDIDSVVCVTAYFLLTCPKTPMRIFQNQLYQ